MFIQEFYLNFSISFLYFLQNRVEQSIVGKFESIDLLLWLQVNL